MPRDERLSDAPYRHICARGARHTERRFCVPVDYWLPRPSVRARESTASTFDGASRPRSRGRRAISVYSRSIAHRSSPPPLPPVIASGNRRTVRCRRLPAAPAGRDVETSRDRGTSSYDQRADSSYKARWPSEHEVGHSSKRAQTRNNRVGDDESAAVHYARPGSRDCFLTSAVREKQVARPTPAAYTRLGRISLPMFKGKSHRFIDARHHLPGLGRSGSGLTSSRSATTVMLNGSAYDRTRTPIELLAMMGPAERVRALDWTPRRTPGLPVQRRELAAVGGLAPPYERSGACRVRC
jgi:hypothetical protein